MDLLLRVHGLLRDAESQQRAYLLTGEQRFLGPYGAAIAALPKSLRNSNSFPRNQRKPCVPAGFATKSSAN